MSAVYAQDHLQRQPVPKAVVMHHPEMLWIVPVYAAHPPQRIKGQLMVQMRVRMEHFIKYIKRMQMGILMVVHHHKYPHLHPLDILDKVLHTYPHLHHKLTLDSLGWMSCIHRHNP